MAADRAPRGVLMTTDADAVVAPQWFQAGLHGLATSELVCGAIEVEELPAEAAGSRIARIEREYGLGRRRTDLLVLWPVKANEPVFQKTVIELKIRHKSLESTIADGLEQTADYMDKCGAGEGHLVIFDRRDDVRWEEKIFKREGEWKNCKIIIWGM